MLRNGGAELIIAERNFRSAGSPRNEFKLSTTKTPQVLRLPGFMRESR